MGVGHALSGHFDQIAEDQGKDDRGQERLQDGPTGPQKRLLVARLQVPPDQEVEKFPVLPELAQTQVRPAPRGSNKDDRRFPYDLSGCPAVTQHVGDIRRAGMPGSLSVTTRQKLPFRVQGIYAAWYKRARRWARSMRPFHCVAP
ncbi:MAG: hypothetical protein QXP27_01875 [Candidatus Methanomethyliaceae archaeon]